VLRNPDNRIQSEPPLTLPRASAVGVSISVLTALLVVAIGLLGQGSEPVAPIDCTFRDPVERVVINQGFSSFHPGIDYDGQIGDPIYAPTCGTIVEVGRVEDSTNYEWGYGWHIKLKDSEGKIRLFAHISKAEVQTGQVVGSGELIARIGSNGNSTGPHLHYEVRVGGDEIKNAIDPEREKRDR